MVCQLECALKLAQDGQLDVVVNQEAQEAASDTHPTRGIRTNRRLLQTRNQATGKLSTKGSAFSYQNWGGQTLLFYQSIEKWDAQMLGQIVTMALEDLVIHRDDNAWFTSVVAPDELDSRAQMCKQSCDCYSSSKFSQYA